MINLTNFFSIYPGPPQAAYELYITIALSSFSLSLAENALATGLVIFKILIVYRDIRELESRVGYVNGLGRDVVRIISILIESGVITFIAQLVHILMYRFDITAYPIIGGPVVQIYVRVSQSIVDFMVFLIMFTRLCREFLWQSFFCVSRWGLPTRSII